MKYFLKRLFTICLLVVIYMVRPGSTPVRDIFALIDRPALEQEQNAPCQESSIVFVENEITAIDFRSLEIGQSVRVRDNKESLNQPVDHLNYDPDVDTPILSLKMPPSRFTADS